jgi:peptidoglycan/LPS O-acetylase OafA/YrhL
MSSVLPIHPVPRQAAQTSGQFAPALKSDAAHRSDIEGLRGIAVLSVLAVHSFPELLKGGFIGVDIFFVLSGYLITGILLRSLAADRFSLIDFYAQRIRRLYPALCLVLVACLAFSVLYVFPSESRHIGQHVAAGAAFMSNIALWKEAGYFDVASESKPLLHLWSLGIEEQFYLLWPVAMVALFRLRRWALTWIVATLLASFLLNVWFIAEKPVATFFLPPTRFWELMIGALLAWLSVGPSGGPLTWVRQQLPTTSRWHGSMADVFCVSGLGMLVVALSLVNKTDQFPGWWALLPTVGTFLLLAAGPEACVNRHLLSHPVLRFYGNISYPLYLWHWPLLCFPVVLGIALSNEVRVVIIVVSVVLAYLSVEFVEKPIRYGPPNRRVPLMLFGAMCCIGVFGWVVKHTDGLLQTYPKSIQEVASIEFRFDGSSIRSNKCLLNLEQGPDSFVSECVDKDDLERPLMMLWGDSHAASLYPGLAAVLGHADDRYRIAQFTASRCPPFQDPPKLASRQCKQTNEFVLDRISSERPMVVVLAGNWQLYGTDNESVQRTSEQLAQTIGRVRALGVSRVVVIGQVPVWNRPVPRLLMSEWIETKRMAERSLDGLNVPSLSIDAALESATKKMNAQFISPSSHLCQQAGCLTSVVQADTVMPVYIDDNHLSVTGSQVFVESVKSALVP